jgi:hypothetical protein
MIPTLLPLYTFGKRMGLHPLHLMGVDANIGSARSRVEVHPLFQYSWQSADAVSREELSQAIYEAENELASYLGYWPAPKWDVIERHELVSVRPGSWSRSLYDINGDNISVKADKGKLISGGTVAKALIEAGAAITYTDVDLDTYFETATITVNTSVTDPEEIAVYYPGLSGDDEWEVRPISVSISGGVATITCRREQLVLKTLLEALDAQAVAGASAGNFLTTVDVYRKYHDPSTQVQLVWRNGCGSCGDSGCTSCSLTIQNGCMTVKDHDLGIVTVSPGTWDADTQTFEYALPDVCRRPDYVRLWYRSGYRNMALATPNNTMDTDYQLAVCKLALGKLDRLIPSSQALAEVQRAWNSDLRKSRATRGESNVYKVTNYELENCPFGTTVAGIEVWRWARNRSLFV